MTRREDCGRSRRDEEEEACERSLLQIGDGARSAGAEIGPDVGCGHGYDYGFDCASHFTK